MYSQVTRSALEESKEGQEGDPVPWILALSHLCLYDVTARQLGARDRRHGGYDGKMGKTGHADHTVGVVFVLWAYQVPMRV